MKDMQTDPTTRFTERVDNYQRFRPSYPPAILAHLERECGLSPQARIADIGCGTGLLARLFLDYGCEVFGVEPNAKMRAAAEEMLGAQPRFHSVEGRAEATTLAPHNVDFVTAGQAFHWFDAAGARRDSAASSSPRAGWCWSGTTAKALPDSKPISKRSSASMLPRKAASMRHHRRSVRPPRLAAHRICESAAARSRGPARTPCLVLIRAPARFAALSAAHGGTGVAICETPA